MCCVLTTLLMAGPRLAIIIWWLVNSARFRLAFDTWVLPILGILFAPWTTLAYVLVAPSGVHGLDWVWIILGILIDLGSYTGGGYGNRKRLRR